MDFTLTTEQSLLKDSVDRFVNDAYGFEQRAKIVDTALGYDAGHWATMAELGWLGLGVPEDAGGLGASGVETMVLMQALGRGLVVEPYLSTCVLGVGLLRQLDAPVAHELMAGIAEGSTKVAVAFVENGQRNDLSRVETRATRDGDKWRLAGKKLLVLGGPSADKLIVVARSAGGATDRAGISLFLVDPDASGLVRHDFRTIDRYRASELTLDGTLAEALIGPEGQALPLVEKMVDEAIVAVSAEAVGAMEKMVEITGEYLKTRQQFGRPIGQFQALQHRMADMFIELEQARSTLYFGVGALEADAPIRARAVSATKAQIGKAMKFVGGNAVQLHGGIGMTEEYAIGHYYKRLTAIEAQFGSTDHHVRRFAAFG